MLQNPHVQSTASIWPNSQNLKQKLSIPLALSISPFNNQQKQGSISQNMLQDYRCQTCKAFINKLCFIRSEHQYDCSICGCTNYLKQSIDINIVQLNNWSYKVKAPQKQRILTSKQRLLIFAIDVSNYGFQSKQLILSTIHTIRQFVKIVYSQKIQLKFTLLCFDSGIHYYSFENKQIIRKIVNIQNNSKTDNYTYCPNFQQIAVDIQRYYQDLMQLFDFIQSQTIQGNLRQGNSLSLFDTIKTSLKISKGYSGKIYFISGLRKQLPYVSEKLNKFYFDQTQRHSFVNNKSLLIDNQMQQLLSKTNMSLSFSFISSHYINSTIFYYISKITNGQLRHYFPNQIQLFFQDLKQNIQKVINQNTGFQTLLKVRYSTGLKLIGNFGCYRSTKITDQYELITCPFDRNYIFQFSIQGKITSDIIVIQFSVLYTTKQGERYFIIQTLANKVKNNIRDIVDTINYSNINLAYIRGITFNIDFIRHPRDLQLVLQERCKKHFKCLKQLAKFQNSNQQQIFQSSFMNKAKPYLILTFLMMKHFILNYNFKVLLHYDLNNQLRSKIFTFNQIINIIWPIIYAINQDGNQIIQMRQKNVPKATVGIFVDRGDQYYLYLSGSSYSAQLRVPNHKQILKQLIYRQQSLKNVRQLINKIMKQKDKGYIDILSLQDTAQMSILDPQGRFGYKNFLNQLINA